MSDKELDDFGIEKKFPDLVGGVTIVQDGPEWAETFTQHGFQSIPGVKMWRKTFKFNKKLKPDQEVTIYVSLPGLNPEYFAGHEGIGRCASGSGQSIKIRGGHHSNSGEDSARAYIFHFEYEGGSCNNFQKEYPHPKYAKHTLVEKHPFPKWIGKVMGFKAALLNTPNGKNVEFWCWFDPSARIENGKLLTENDWKLRYHDTDEGQFKKPTAPKAKPPFLETHGKLTEFRMDNASKNTKAFCASVREIQRL